MRLPVKLIVTLVDGAIAKGVAGLEARRRQGRPGAVSLQPALRGPQDLVRPLGAGGLQERHGR